MDYPNLESKSAALYQRALKVLPDGNSRTTIALKPYPIYIESGSGADVIDVDGNRYIDYVGSWGPMILGHAHPEILRAVRRAAGSQIETAPSIRPAAVSRSSSSWIPKTCCTTSTIGRYGVDRPSAEQPPAIHRVSDGSLRC